MSGIGMPVIEMPVIRVAPHQVRLAGAVKQPAQEAGTVIKFLLENTPHEPVAVDPHCSVLDYLREELQQKGTKEGCASGDCGACSVVIAEAIEGKLQYTSANACITPLASLHGKQLIIVEHLSDGDELHPVQQAMVDCHGSQCGFCTPGFVMSMFAYRKNHAAAPFH